MVLTLKFSEWSVAERLPEFVARVRGWGYRDVRMRQLVTGGQEICLVALRRKALRRLGGKHGRKRETAPVSRKRARMTAAYHAFRAAFLIFGLARLSARIPGFAEEPCMRWTVDSVSRALLSVLAVAGLSRCRGVAAAGSRRAACPTPTRLRVGQLVFHSDFELPADHRLVRELTAERDDICRTLGLPPSNEPIDVYLFRDAERYSEYLEAEFPERAVAAGVLSGDRHAARRVRALERPRGGRFAARSGARLPARRRAGHSAVAGRRAWPNTSKCRAGRAA